MAPVACADDDNVRTIRLLGEERANAIDREVVVAITDALSTVTNDTKVVVLASAGPVFCAGADRAMLHALAADVDGPLRARTYSSFQRLIVSIGECPVPVVTRIQGPALGAGADLALACDIRVASTDAWLEETWVRYGLVSALGGAAELVATVGRGTALYSLLTAERISASRAAELGLFQKVVDGNELDDAVGAVTQAIRGLDRSAVVHMKSMVRRLADVGLAANLRDARERQLALLGGDGFRAAVG